MKDVMGQDIEAGDEVAYASNSDGPCLSVGTVVGPCKNGEGRIRVRVTVSSTRAGQGLAPYGRRRLREPGTPYVATIGHPERVIIVRKAVGCNPTAARGMLHDRGPSGPTDEEKEGT